MRRVPRLSAADEEAVLVRAGFVWLQSKGSHRIYASRGRRVIVPFHGSATLHAKIVKQVIEAIEEGAIQPIPPGQRPR